MSSVSASSYQPLLEQLQKQYRIETSLLSLLKSCSLRDELLAHPDCARLLRRTEQVLSATSRLIKECHRVHAPDALELEVKAAPSPMISVLQHAERERSIVEYLRLLQGFLEHVSSGYLVLHSISQSYKVYHCERVTLINLKAINPLRDDITKILPSLAHQEFGSVSNKAAGNPAQAVFQNRS